MAKRAHTSDGKPRNNSGADAHGVARDQLRSFVERIERLEEEKKTIADDINSGAAVTVSAGTFRIGNGGGNGNLASGASVTGAGALEFYKTVFGGDNSAGEVDG